jgi:hypothetical protein
VGQVSARGLDSPEIMGELETVKVMTLEEKSDH